MYAFVFAGINGDSGYWILHGASVESFPSILKTIKLVSDAGGFM